MIERLRSGRDFVNPEGDVKPMSDLRDDGEYELLSESLVLATEPSEVMSYIDAKRDKPVWTVRDKQQDLRENFGLDPWSPRERGEAIECVVGGKFGALKHLNEVLLHQKKNQSVEDPASALRSIVSEYGDYAGSARREAGALTMFYGELDDLNPTAKIDTYAQLNAAGAQRVSAAIKRRLLVNEYLRNDEFPDPLSKNINGDEQIVTIENRVKDLSIGKMKKSLGYVITSERKRHEFWVDRLGEAKSHMAVGKMAQAVLARVTNKPEVES